MDGFMLLRYDRSPFRQRASLAVRDCLYFSLLWIQHFKNRLIRVIIVPDVGGELLNRE